MPRPIINNRKINNNLKGAFQVIYYDSTPHNEQISDYKPVQYWKFKYQALLFPPTKNFELTLLSPPDIASMSPVIDQLACQTTSLKVSRT